jgi:NAD(P)-dependent dehydrogenase (short-subunit alcohol dehydrogenase family)
MGRNAALLEEHAKKLGLYTKTSFQTVDVTQESTVQHAFSRAERLFGPVTILVNNAGQAESQPCQKTTLQTWNHMLEVNLTGTFLCTRAALPGMLEAGWGRIINIASTAGLIGYPYVTAYCAAKHGVIGLTRALALELARKNITVNAVCPGYTDTDIVRDAVTNIAARTGRSADEAQAELTRHNPQGRLIQRAEIADTVLWLCQPSSGSITGQAIAVAGGEVM